MSSVCGKLCYLIIEEYFGEDVAKVAKDIFKYGPKTLRLIFRSVNLPLKTVRHCLCVLIRYGLVLFEPSSSGVAEYQLIMENVLNMLHYHRYLLVAKSTYGSEAEMIVEEILRLGNATALQIVVGAYNRLSKQQRFTEINKSKLQSLRDIFDVLVNKQYIKQCSSVSTDTIPIEIPLESFRMFKPPKIDLGILLNVCQGSEFENVDNSLWTINYSRFHQDMRDDILVLAICRRVSTAGGEAFRQLLRQSHLISNSSAPNSNPVPFSLVRDACRKSKVDGALFKHLEEYLSIISEDQCGFITKESGTPVAFIVNTKAALEELTWCVLSGLIEVRYGSDAARIFRLIREQKFIEQDEIQKRAMLPDKECKLLTYTLLQAGWIQQQELRKGLIKAGPVKTFFLFYIDLLMVVRLCIEICYKSLTNAITRRNYELSQNATLLEKKQRIDAVSLHMRETGASEEEVAEIAELITPPEAVLLKKTQSNINQLDQSEIQINDTLFILQLYVSFL